MRLIDELMTAIGERAQEFILKLMLYALLMLAGLTAFFVFTGALKAWGWL